MRQSLEIKKEIEQKHNPLWWKPLFAAKRQLNHRMNDIFIPFRLLPAFLMPYPSDIEEQIFSSAQSKTHRLFSQLFNTRQMLTPRLSSNNTAPYIDIIENSSYFKLNADVPGIKAEDLDISILIAR